MRTIAEGTSGKSDAYETWKEARQRSDDDSMEHDTAVATPQTKQRT